MRLPEFEHTLREEAAMALKCIDKMKTAAQWAAGSVDQN
jgi:hypothetical protein